MVEMTPRTFARKWSGARLKERSASQEHFIDLCRMIGHAGLAGRRTFRTCGTVHPCQHQTWSSLRAGWMVIHWRLE
jgi:hypothetical protein